MKVSELTGFLDRLIEDWSRERPDLDIDHKQLVYAIFILRSLFSREADETLTEWSLNFTSYGVLATLRRIGKPYRMTPGELSRVLGLTTGGTSNILRRLEDLGLVSRHRDDGDRRSVMVELTALGKKTVDAAATTVTRNEAARLGVLNARDRAMLYRLLRRVIATFGD